ncbi:MAG: sugar phosphate isomerase/epimerase [Anaerolineae bacterium]|nr:sugar phosphate isomerase/epimerase [Anaerolineae bacterium]
MGRQRQDLDDGQLAQAKALLAKHGMKVACIGSPVGKSPIDDPIAHELDVLRRLFVVGEALDTRRIRIFSFYPPDTSTNAHYAQYVAAATDRLAQMAELAGRAGFVLLHENEKAIVGDTPQRCRALLEGVNSPHLRAIWDAANYVQVGISQPMAAGWPLVGDYVAYIHVKDARAADGRVTAAGEGDGQLAELLTALMARSYQGFLALEPHLADAGHSSGFSGPEGCATRSTRCAA